MKQDYTHIAVVLDASGSMEVTRSDTIGGFNRFIEDQRKEPGEATLSLTLFNTELKPRLRFEPLLKVGELTKEQYQPSGMTALLDAIAYTIQSTGQHLADMPEDQRPSRVIFVIMTDGQENSSKVWRKSAIKELIEHQQQHYAWQFMFLGANQDAFYEAGGLGIGAGQTMNYAANDKGTQDAFSSVSHSVARYRSGGDAAFSAEDRQKQKDAGA